MVLHPEIKTILSVDICGTYYHCQFSQWLRRNDGGVAWKRCSFPKQYPALLDPNIRQRVDDQDAKPEMERVVDGN